MSERRSPLQKHMTLKQLLSGPSSHIAFDLRNQLLRRPVTRPWEKNGNTATHYYTQRRWGAAASDSRERRCSQSSEVKGWKRRVRLFVGKKTERNREVRRAARWAACEGRGGVSQVWQAMSSGLLVFGAAESQRSIGRAKARALHPNPNLRSTVLYYMTYSMRYCYSEWMKHTCIQCILIVGWIRWMCIWSGFSPLSLWGFLNVRLMWEWWASNMNYMYLSLSLSSPDHSASEGPFPPGETRHDDRNHAW